VQRAFRAKYAKDRPADKTIRVWYKLFTETGCLCKQKSSGRPFTAEDDVERVPVSFLHSPKKSTGTAAKELSMSKTTVCRVLRKRLVFKPYRIQMVQLWDEDPKRRLDFCLQLQDLMSSDYHFLLEVQFSDEVTFHVSGAIYRHNVRICGSENPHAYVQHQRDCPKVNVFSTISTHLSINKGYQNRYHKNELQLYKQDTAKYITITPKQTGPTKGHIYITQSTGTKEILL